MEGKKKSLETQIAFVITREKIQYMVLVYLIISVEKGKMPTSHHTHKKITSVKSKTLHFDF